VDVLLVIDRGVLGRIELTDPGEVRGVDAVDQLQDGRRHHRFDDALTRTSDVEECVRLLDAGGDDASRSGAIDGWGRLDHTRGQQSGG
jgi:hypothetical protein